MNNFVKVYYVDANGVYQGRFRLEKEGYQAKAGETTVAKPSLREPMVIEGGTWRGATDEEYAAWLAANPKKKLEPAQPSAQDKLNADTTLQLAQLAAKSKQQDELNARLTIDVATLKQALQKSATTTQA